MKLSSNEIKFASIDELKDKKEALEKVLKEGQGKARTRTLNAQETIEHVKNMIELLNNLVPKTYQTKVELHYIEDAQTFPNAYKSVPYGTGLVLTKYTNYYVLLVWRENCNKSKYDSVDYSVNLDNCKHKDKIKKHIFTKALKEIELENNANIDDFIQDILFI